MQDNNVADDWVYIAMYYGKCIESTTSFLCMLNLTPTDSVIISR